MASYNNDYNRAIARRQKGLDVANLKNDYEQSLMTPLHGGGYSGGDFWSDFADGFMSVWNPIIDTAGKVAPLLPLVGLGESGGDMSVNAPYEGYVYGSGYSGGEEQPFMGYGMSGGAIANDGIPPFNMPTNAGMSGGKASLAPKWKVKQGDFCCIKSDSGMLPCNGNPLPKAFMNDYRKKSRDFQAYRQARGAGMSGGDEVSDTDHPLLRNPELQATMFLGGRKPSSVSKKEKIGMVQQVIADMLARKQGKGISGGDFLSDLGDTFSKVAPFLPLLGLGYSGGAGESGGQARHLQKQVGNKLLKAQLKNLHGRGLSGGDFDWSSLLSFAPLLLGLGMSGGEVDMDELSELEPLVKGLGMSGGNFWDDLSKGFSDAWNWVKDTAVPAVVDNLDTIGKVADTAGKINKAYQGKGVSGGAMTYEQNMNMADAMGDIFSGMGKASDTRMKSGKVQLYKGGALQTPRSNVNQPYLTGVAGGAGASGGDFLGDLGNTLSKVAPFLPLLGLGASGGDYFEDKDFTGMGVSGGKKKKTTRQGKMNERLAMKIAHLQGRGLEPTADMEASNKIVGLMAKTNPEVDRKVGEGVSGGKKTSKWIEHVKAYAKQHGIKYGEALKRAKATYRG